MSQPPPSLSAPELILSLMDSAADPALSANYLVCAGALFGIEPQTIRVALTRLTRTTVLTQLERGRYGVGRSGGPLHGAVRNWQNVEEGLVDWHGEWLAVYLAHLGRGRAAVRRRERALRLAGLAAAEAGLWIRPANLAASLDTFRTRLIDLGLEPVARVLHVDEILPEGAIRPRRLWDVTALEDGYRQRIDTLERSTAGLPDLGDDAAARETLLVGRDVTRAILTDPLLPAELIDSGLRRAMIDAMRAYDRLGKAAWRRFYLRNA